MKITPNIDIALSFNQVTATLNNRELAYVIWLAIAFCAAMLSSKLRDSLWRVLKSLFPWKFTVVYIATIGYFSLMIHILRYSTFWDTALLKDTVFWGILTASSLMFRVAGRKDPLNFLKNTLKDSLKISAFLSFVLNLTIFSFWLEFAVVPILFLFIGMYEVSKLKKEHKLARKSLEVLAGISSILLVAYVIYDVLTNHQLYINVHKGKEFILPILLTILFIPFLALLNILVQYEEIGSGLRRMSKNKIHYYKMLLSALFYFNFNIKGAIRWRNSFVYINKGEELWKSMRTIRLQQIKENTPPENPELEGWNPIDAKQFLENRGLLIKKYNSNLGDIWEGKSNNQKLDEDFMTGSCSFSIKGNKHIVHELRLHLTCYDSSRTTDPVKFIDILKDLYLMAVYEDVPYKIKDSILRHKNLNYDNPYTNVKIHFNNWKNEKKGYDLHTVITHKNLNQAPSIRPSSASFVS